MKLLVIFIAALSITVSAFCGDEERESDLNKLPKGILYSKLSEDEHQYIIKDIYVTQVLKDTLKYDPEYQKDEIPNCNSLEIDTVARTVKVVTKKKIADPKELINKLAKSGGCVPTWAELSLREKRSDDFDYELYKLVYSEDIDFDCALAIYKFVNLPNNKIKAFGYSRSGDQKTNHAEYIVSFEEGGYELKQVGKTKRLDWPDHSVQSREPPDKLKLRHARNEEGLLRFNDATSHCTCYSRYAMRIFGEDGRYIWEDQSEIYGNYYPVINDFDGDGVDEIVVFREDHGDSRILVFQKKE